MVTLRWSLDAKADAKVRSGQGGHSKRTKGRTAVPTIRLDSSPFLGSQSFSVMQGVEFRPRHSRLNSRKEAAVYRLEMRPPAAFHHPALNSQTAQIPGKERERVSYPLRAVLGLYYSPHAGWTYRDSGRFEQKRAETSRESRNRLLFDR